MSRDNVAYGGNQIVHHRIASTIIPPLMALSETDKASLEAIFWQIKYLKMEYRHGVL